jgi:hypothetical protein
MIAAMIPACALLPLACLAVNDFVHFGVLRGIDGLAMRTGDLIRQESELTICCRFTALEICKSWLHSQTPNDCSELIYRKNKN